ncbi:MAG TPA: LysR family transcriptional regulator [Sphingomonas sp.]|jgi:DNA-binding transcriptional LysR family regulator|uniref:LysR family transcriptional regulator n=1 Tax=Sphingomonas sp. TaxID=28214 RepID=UPI002EDA8953
MNRFDLNLLVALNALLEEGSVTRAARRLNLSQPATSSALRRLREAFGDEILVANGKRMVPTPHALSLAPMVAEALGSMQALLASSTLFDPATSQRVFRIAASDYVITVAVVPLLRELAVTAPGIGVEMRSPNSGTTADLERGTVDLIISPEQFQSAGHPRDLLFEERHVILGCRDNPIFSAPITEDIYARVGHVVVEVSNTLSFVEEFVRTRGDRRRIEVVASSFTSVPWMLAGTNRVALVHERLAHAFVDKLPLAFAAPPFDIPPMREMVQYHRTRAQDEGLRWLRNALISQTTQDDIARSSASPPGA